MATGNTSFATLATTTLSNFANDIFDAVVTNNAALNELKKAGNIKIVKGGKTFTHPVFYAANSTFAAIDKFGTIPTDMQDPLTRAEYNVKVVAGSVVYNLVEEAMNAGDKEKLIDYVEALKMVAETSMSEILGDQIMKAEASVGANDFDSIPYIISNSPSAQTVTVGGISTSNTNSYWQNYAYTTAVSAFNTSNAGLIAMDTALNGATFGTQGPTFVITTKAVFSLYMLSMTPNIRYTNTDRAANGIKNLYYTTLPVMFDDNCPAYHMYMIDGNSLKLQVLSQGNMKMTPGQPSFSQLMVRHLLYFLGNLTCGSRRTNAVVSAITA